MRSYWLPNKQEIVHAILGRVTDMGAHTIFDSSVLNANGVEDRLNGALNSPGLGNIYKSQRSQDHQFPRGGRHVRKSLQTPYSHEAKNRRERPSLLFTNIVWMEDMAVPTSELFESCS